MTEKFQQENTAETTNPTDIMLEAYRQKIKECARTRSTDPIPNSGDKHASIMLAEMFHQTKNQLLMVAGCFKGDVSSDPQYLYELEELFKKGISAKFIILDDKTDDEEDSPALQLIKRYRSQKVLLNKATQKTKEALGSKLNKDQDGNLMHFAVFDDTIFRLEVMPKRFAAIGNFNDQVNNKKLTEIFNYIHPTTTPLI